jgi:cysteine desulfuration protein SufE|tara:strand:- start:568 stop:975 length:408 start_codon:yes stop_codon:yes gene_type:complete
MILDKIKNRGEDMSILQGHDRLQYIIDEAKKVEPLPEEYKIEENKIRGCISNLWVTGKVLENGTMQYKHDADSHMTKGTAKVILDIVNGEHRSEVANLTLESFMPLGIRELLTMQRQVGFASLIERVIKVATNDG